MSIQGASYIGAAVIAASAAFAGLILGKEQKTTEFRQEWINAQREDIATLLATAKMAIEQPKKAKGERMNFDLAHGRMLLRENPDRAEWSLVLDEVERLRLYAFDLPNGANVETGGRRIVELSRRLLKVEWNRVRSGERWFRLIKAVLPPAIGLTVWALAYGKGFIIIH